MKTMNYQGVLPREDVQLEQACSGSGEGESRAPLISVMMPAYNCERYVAQAVESILVQTYSDFEFLIVDDGSTDGTLKILKRYAERDPRIHLVSRPNTGLVIALNEMLARARGEFLARMDADDISLPERFERQISFLREHPEIVCVGSAVMEIDAAGRDLIVTRFYTDDASIQELMLKGQTHFFHPTVMMRREAVTAVGGYREEMWPAEDLDLWLRLGERARLANLEMVLLRYRIHPESICSRGPVDGYKKLRMASEQACDRRGIPRRFQPVAHCRMGDNRCSKHEFSTRYGWWGFLRGDRRTALHYALQAIRWMPLRRSGWHLLACTILKPIRRGV